jgi:hypothetical protein
LQRKKSKFWTGGWLAFLGESGMKVSSGLGVTWFDSLHGGLRCIGMKVV